MAQLPIGRILSTLQNGQIDQVSRIPWGSNYTFLVRICWESDEIEAIYKPQKGERPLWDFPRGTLCHRERAAFIVSDALAWQIVPPTILRGGPHGFGSVQFFIEHDPEMHYFTLVGDHTDQLRRIMLFDCLVNNADRKGGHILLDSAGKLWSIDHGICFHVEEKLRTVIWDFAGEPLPTDLHDDLTRLQMLAADESAEPWQELRVLLSKREISALRKRLDRLVTDNCFPIPGPGRHYPWPPV